MPAWLNGGRRSGSAGLGIWRCGRHHLSSSRMPRITRSRIADFHYKNLLFSRRRFFLVSYCVCQRGTRAVGWFRWELTSCTVLFPSGCFDCEGPISAASSCSRKLGGERGRDSLSLRECLRSAAEDRRTLLPVPLRTLEICRNLVVPQCL